jgi:pimeloyl-ACP methyl ester carboxylesterase
VSRPTLFLLHALGLSARSWNGVVAALGDDLDVVAFDLPGYGDAAASSRITVEETAESVAAAIRDLGPDTWLIAGHSMGGRIAAIVTAWAERGERGLIPPAGLVLVGASTPGPEPMDEARRERMAGWWADGRISEEDAAGFVDANLASVLPAEVRAAAIEDVRRSSRTAFLAWLHRGSLEDWSDAVGVLRTPAAIVVGEQDADLGARNQRRLEVPHVPGASVHEVDGAAHYVLLERPAEVARRIAGLWDAVRDRPRLPAAFARLIASDRVAARTRRVMLARLGEPPADAPRALSPAQRGLLTEVLARVVPQRGTDVDLAARIDVQLATGGGDGWRFAELPPDAEAWRRGLDTIAALEPGFAGLDAAAQDAAIDRFAAGEAGSDEPGMLSAGLMALWFQDVQAEAVRTWVAHPAAQAWLRYDGFADGGDGPRKQGFTATRAGEWEAWQRDWRTGKELQA